MRFWPGSKKLDWYLGWPAFIRTYVFGQKLVQFRKPLLPFLRFVKMFATLSLYFFFDKKMEYPSRHLFSFIKKVKLDSFERLRELFLSSFSKFSSRTYSQPYKHKAARSFHFVSLCTRYKANKPRVVVEKQSTRSERGEKKIRKEILFYEETRLIAVRCFFTVDTCPFIILAVLTFLFPLMCSFLVNSDARFTLHGELPTTRPFR